MEIGRDDAQSDGHGSLAKYVGRDDVVAFLDPDSKMVKRVDVIGAQAHDSAEVATSAGLERPVEFIVNGGSNRRMLEDPCVFELFDEFCWTTSPAWEHVTLTATDGGS